MLYKTAMYFKNGFFSLQKVEKMDTTPFLRVQKMQRNGKHRPDGLNVTIHTIITVHQDMTDHNSMSFAMIWQC